MTDPIRDKLLLKPLANIFELEFLRRKPESSGVCRPELFRGDRGGRGPLVPLLPPTPHWSTSL